MLFHIEAVQLPNGVYSALVDTTEVGLALTEREACQLAYNYIYQNYKTIHSKPLKQKLIWHDLEDAADLAAVSPAQEIAEDGCPVATALPVEVSECKHNAMYWDENGKCNICSSEHEAAGGCPDCGQYTVNCACDLHPDINL